MLRLGHTRYETGFPVTRLGRMQVGVASKLISRLAELNAQRKINAARLGDSLHDLPGVALPALLPGAEPVYARFPVRILNAAARERVVEALESAGIGATRSYPRALVDVPQVAAALRPGLREVTGARTLARQIVTLPTHAYCPPDLAERVRRIVQTCLAETAA
jgi:dTDP-4-amino-4,6-dideoxygalactose transaminase